MVTTLAVEVVDMATTHISLTASLGEYFSSSYFIVLYHSYFVLVSCFEITKHKKIQFVLLDYLLLVIYFMHLKTKKNKKIFVFLNPMQKWRCRNCWNLLTVLFFIFFCNSNWAEILTTTATFHDLHTCKIWENYELFK